MMDFVEDEKAAGEILRSLLTPKMESSMVSCCDFLGKRNAKRLSRYNGFIDISFQASR